MSPTIEQQRPGRSVASIVRVSTKDKGFVFARLLATGEECFVHRSGVPPELWPTLELGDAITCKVSDTSKGIRGYDVAAGSDTDAARVADAVDDWGNR
jgi:cold shock CspA family protein